MAAKASEEERALVETHMGTPDGRLALARSLIGYFQGRSQSLMQTISSADHYEPGHVATPLVEEVWGRLLEYGLNPDEIRVGENHPTLTEAKEEALRLYDQARKRKHDH